MLEGHLLLCRLSTQLASSVSEMDGSLLVDDGQFYKFSARIGSCDTRVSRRRCPSTCTDRRRILLPACFYTTDHTNHAVCAGTTLTLDYTDI